MDVKEKWNEDGNIKKNLKILKIVKKEKKIDDMCARLRAAGAGGSEALKNRKLIISCQPWWKR